GRDPSGRARSEADPGADRARRRAGPRGSGTEGSDRGGGTAVGEDRGSGVRVDVPGADLQLWAAWPDRGCFGGRPARPVGTGTPRRADGLVSVVSRLRSV